MRGVLARVPPSWQMIQIPSFDSQSAAFRRGSIQVILSVARYDDGASGFMSA